MAVAAARQKQQKRPPQQAGGKGFGNGPPSTPSLAEPVPPQLQNAPKAPQQQQADAVLGQQANAALGGNPAAQPPSSSTPAAALPAVSRARIFAACAQVTVVVTALAFGLRAVAPAVSPAVADGQADTVEALLNCEYSLLLFLYWLAGLLRLLCACALACPLAAMLWDGHQGPAAALAACDGAPGSSSSLTGWGPCRRWDEARGP